MPNGRQRILVRRNIMKILRYVCTKLVIVAIAWSFAAAASIQARQPRSSSGSVGSANAYLIVNRAANFGTRWRPSCGYRP
jgi:hypothetical protein